MYKYREKPFDKIVAAELIIELFNGKKNIKLQSIREKIIKTHKERGGNPPGIGQRGKPHTYHWQTSLALDALKALQFADNPNSGYWNFLSHNEMISELKKKGHNIL